MSNETAASLLIHSVYANNNSLCRVHVPLSFYIPVCTLLGTKPWSGHMYRYTTYMLYEERAKHLTATIAGASRIPPGDCSNARLLQVTTGCLCTGNNVPPHIQIHTLKDKVSALTPLLLLFLAHLLHSFNYKRLYIAWLVECLIPHYYYI